MLLRQTFLKNYMPGVEESIICSASDKDFCKFDQDSSTLFEYNWFEDLVSKLPPRNSSIFINNLIIYACVYV